MTLKPADLDRLEQLAREARDGSGYTFDPATEALARALSPAVVSELVAAARLGAAWQEAEAALPEGWSVGGIIQRARSGDGWQGVAMRLSEAVGYPNAATIEGPQRPTLALVALAEALRKRP